MQAQPTEHRVTVNGVSLAYFEWGERSDSTHATVLLAHATGFHARCWDRTVALLARDTHIISLDQRGHGRSGKAGPFSWLTFGTDLTEFVKALDLAGVCGVGHSMGGRRDAPGRSSDLPTQKPLARLAGNVRPVRRWRRLSTRAARGATSIS